MRALLPVPAPVQVIHYTFSKPEISDFPLFMG